MKPSPLEALEAIADATQQQLDMFADALRRPDVDVAGLARVSLELMFQAVASELRKLKDDAELPPQTREKFRRLVEQVEALKRSSVRLEQYLSDLSRDFRCSRCGKDVASGAQVSGWRKGAPKVELICASCRATTPLTDAGMWEFQRRFGHLVGPDWVPERHGFASAER